VHLWSHDLLLACLHLRLQTWRAARVSLAHTCSTVLFVCPLHVAAPSGPIKKGIMYAEGVRIDAQDYLGDW
jgi:hypothetical protein